MAPFLTRSYADIAVGERFVSRGRTITESDNINFSLMTMNMHPLHCDRAYAEKSEFGQTSGTKVPTRARGKGSRAATSCLGGWCHRSVAFPS